MVCTGLVLAADGKKMSKRDKNFPDPEALLDEYGADALRLYLLDSPAAHASSLSFDALAVKSVVSSVLLPIYNAATYLHQNWHRFLQSDMGTSSDVWSTSSSDWLDLAMMASADELVRVVTRAINRFDLSSAAAQIKLFADDLANVHVRLGRPRLNGSFGPAAATSSLHSLDYTLLQFAKSAAPLVPHTADMVYQMLKEFHPSSQESVHLECMPSVGSGHDYLEQMTLVKTAMVVIDLCRKIRQQVKLPVRLPLKSLTMERNLPESLLNCIKTEMNIDSIHVSQDSLSTISLQLNFATAAPRLGKVAKEIDRELRSLDFLPDMASGLLIKGHHLDQEDVILRKALKTCNPNEHAAMHDDVVVCVDIDVSRVQVDRWLRREAIHLLQILRKNAQLKPLQKAYGAFSDYILSGDNLPVIVVDWQQRPRHVSQLTIEACSNSPHSRQLTACLWTNDSEDIKRE